MANPAPGYAKKPEHRVDLLPETRRVRVVFNGTVIADSTAALRCEETGHEPVHYIPEKDIRLDLMRPTDHTSYCPFKGDATYFSVPAGGDKAQNAVWEYLDPFPAVAEIEGRVAFYPDRVDAVEELDD